MIFMFLQCVSPVIIVYIIISPLNSYLYIHWILDFKKILLLLPKKQNIFNCFPFQCKNKLKANRRRVPSTLRDKLKVELEKMVKLGALLCKKYCWKWSHEHENVWQDLKKLLTHKPVLTYYDVTLKTKVSTDACEDSLGTVLLQMHGNDWKPVA